MKSVHYKWNVHIHRSSSCCTTTVSQQRQCSPDNEFLIVEMLHKKEVSATLQRCQRKVSIVEEHLVSCSERDVGIIPNQVIDTTRFQSPFSNCTSGRWGFVLFATAYRAECKLVWTVSTLFVYRRLWWSWIHKKDWASEECWLLLYWPKSRVSDRPWEFARRQRKQLGSRADQKYSCGIPYFFRIWCGKNPIVYMQLDCFLANN